MDVELQLSEREKELEKKHHQEEEHEKAEHEADDMQHSTWFNFFMSFIWIAATAIMIFYLVQIVQQYQDSKANPSSTILFVEQSRLPMPQIVICNWNQDGNVLDPTPAGNCETCNLTLVSCNYNVNVSCEDAWTKIYYNTSGGQFTCYQYNADPTSLEYSNLTGYSGSMATIWAVPLLNRTDDPKSMNRLGVQATFKPIGTITANDIYSEINFASMGFDTFFALTYINTIHNELEGTDQYNTSSYDTTASTVNLLQDDSANITTGYIGVSFAYQTLSLQQVTFDIAYNLNNLFGDFSGMIGTLMGLDLIKVCAGIPMGYLAWRSRSLDPLREAFNG